MSDTIQALARSLGADIHQLNTIGHNVSNIGTTGFRSQRVTADFAQHAGLVTVDQADGALASTDRPLDLALRGPGFFVVEHAGEERLVRAGEFRLDGEGFLVNAAGDRVLGEGGPLRLATANVHVDATGLVREGERDVDRLRVVTVANPTLLRAADGGYAYAGEPAAWRGAVVQGSLEKSNVDAADQTIRLTELVRHTESVQRALSIYDKAMDTGINRLGE